MCRAFEELEERGFNRGREEERTSIARNLLAIGKLALEEIAKCSNLPLAKVQELAQEMGR